VVLATKSTLGNLSLSHAVCICPLLLGRTAFLAHVALLATVKTDVATQIGVHLKQMAT